MSYLVSHASYVVTPNASLGDIPSERPCEGIVDMLYYES